MAQIKSTDRIAEKWARVTPQRSQDYAEGIDNPRRDWAQATAAAADAWRDGITKAATSGQFARNVTRVGTAKWQAKARAKGATRFSEGVQIAQPDYAAGFAPYADVIKNTALPPRYAKGDPRNLERVKAIATALSKKRTGTSV
jgi:hypothetical protein